MKYDIKNNIRHNIVLLIVVGILMVIASMQLHTKLVHMEQTGYWGDYLLNIFGGVRIFDFSNRNLNFDVPKEYLILTLTWGLVGLRYISSDYSKNVAVFYKSKKKWLVCKVVSNFVVISLVYSMGIVIAGVTSDFSIGFNEVVDKQLFKVEMLPKCTGDFSVVLAGCILMTFAISLMQIMISVIFNNFVGFTAIMGIYVVSMFGCSEFLIGNGIMLLRYDIFAKRGIDATANLSIAVVVVVIMAYIATRAVKKKDIL